MTLQTLAMGDAKPPCQVKKPPEEMRVSAKYDFLESFLLPWLNQKEVPSEHELPAGVSVSLDQSDLWQQFFELTNEMIVTRRGRKMFPVIKLGVNGLEEKAAYLMVLEFVQVKDNKYRFLHGDWNTSAPGKAEPPRLAFSINPKGIQLGEVWKRDGISFSEVKITNDKNATTMMSLNSMHVYEPRLHVIRMKHTDRFGWSPVSLWTQRLHITSFVAVTAYQNDKVTQLKVKHNPFARAFNRSATAVTEYELGIPPGSIRPHTGQPPPGQGYLPINFREVQQTGGQRKFDPRLHHHTVASEGQNNAGFIEEGSPPAYAAAHLQGHHLPNTQLMNMANCFNTTGVPSLSPPEVKVFPVTAPASSQGAAAGNPTRTPVERPPLQQTRTPKRPETGKSRTVPYSVQRQRQIVQKRSASSYVESLSRPAEAGEFRVKTQTPSPTSSNGEGSLVTAGMQLGYGDARYSNASTVDPQGLGHYQQYMQQTNAPGQYVGQMTARTPSPEEQLFCHPQFFYSQQQYIQQQQQGLAADGQAGYGYDPSATPQYYCDNFTMQDRQMGRPPNNYAGYPTTQAAGGYNGSYNNQFASSPESSPSSDRVQPAHASPAAYYFQQQQVQASEQQQQHNYYTTVTSASHAATGPGSTPTSTVPTGASSAEAVVVVDPNQQVSYQSMTARTEESAAVADLGEGFMSASTALEISNDLSNLLNDN